jgi:hypothetical protein
MTQRHGQAYEPQGWTIAEAAALETGEELA